MNSVIMEKNRQPIDFYSNEIVKNQEKLSKAKRKLFWLSTLRLFIFLIAVAGTYFFWEKTGLVTGIIVGSITLFLFLISRYTDAQYERDKLKALIAVNEVEIAVLQRNYADLPDGHKFKDSNHAFSQDIDLFGTGSFYQYSNRTALEQGSKKFAAILTANSIAAIPDKQEAIKELGGLPAWRQEFTAIANLVKVEVSHRIVSNWLKQYQRFIPQIMRSLPLIFSLISVVAFWSFYMGWLNEWGLIAWFFLGLGITGTYLKKVSQLSARATQSLSTFQQYEKLISKLEKQPFESKILIEKRAIILREGKRTSTILKDFAGILNAIDQRNNLIIGIFGNAFLLWDLRQSYRLEKWIAKYGAEVEDWFDTIAFFDAYNSLGNFAFNHPTYAYPKIISTNSVINAKNAGHPLLDPEKSVANHMDINREQFFIITGANMAGKSTFLRTVALQLVMANSGLPVCASEMEYGPMKLITSMRTTDSLADDESYFFSELKRLKYIVDQMEEDTYFIILDEILKGTNSTDKAIGSQKFVERMVASYSTGIIATHDLSLCEISERLPQVQNYYFDADIIADELHFDYKFKKGICKNMNASFLLRKMKIV